MQKRNKKQKLTLEQKLRRLAIQAHARAVQKANEDRFDKMFGSARMSVFDLGLTLSD